MSAYAATPYYHVLKNEAGSENSAVDGSTTPVEFFWKCVRQCHLYLFSVQIRDKGTFTASGYGKDANPLPNGVLVEHRAREHINGQGPTEVRNELNDEYPIRKNSDWALFAPRTSYFDIGSGDNFLTARWEFMAAGSPIKMMPGDRIMATIQDDLTTLEHQIFTIQGFNQA